MALQKKKLLFITTGVITVAVSAGILTLPVPRLLNYIIAIYLIVFGILGLVR